MTFKILSLDGGGIKGVFPVALLAQLEKCTKIDRIGDYFDLIAGTSTGSIIALGLAIGLSAREVLDFYETHGPEIFEPQQLILGLLQSKYKQNKLRAALNLVFENKVLADARRRVLVPALQADPCRNKLYKTAHHKDFRHDHTKSIVEIALSSCAAPIYFNANKDDDGSLMLDGGLWANNPVDLAVIEAITYLGHKAGSIRVLSLGCTSCLDTITGLSSKGGAAAWMNPKDLNLVGVLLAMQAEASTNKAKLLAGESNFVRINPPVEPGRFAMDDASAVQIKELKRLGVVHARENSAKIADIFLENFAEPFEPVHEHER